MSQVSAVARVVLDVFLIFELKMNSNPGKSEAIVLFHNAFEEAARRALYEQVDQVELWLGSELFLYLFVAFPIAFNMILHDFSNNSFSIVSSELFSKKSLATTYVVLRYQHIPPTGC